MLNNQITTHKKIVTFVLLVASFIVLLPKLSVCAYPTSEMLFSKDNNVIQMNKKQENLTNQIYSKDKYLSTKSSKSFELEKIFVHDGKKIAFLTFDDGPTPNITPKVLQILDEYNVKATFFVVGTLAQSNQKLLKEEVLKGHSIGNHTYSHDYKYLYHSPENFLCDINKCDSTLKHILGSDFSTRLIRFPGGTLGWNADRYIRPIQNKGYAYIDWNASIGDAEGLNIPKEKLLKNLKDSTEGQNHIVVLMHDAATKKTTVEALPEIIQYLKSQGYEFKTIK